MAKKDETKQMKAQAKKPVETEKKAEGSPQLNAAQLALEESFKEALAENEKLKEFERLYVELKKTSDKLASDKLSLEKKLKSWEDAATGTGGTHPKFYIDGESFDVTHIETAFAVRDLMQKRFIDQDQTVVVLDKHGA